MNILLVEDDLTLGPELRDRFSNSGHNATLAKNAAEGEYYAREYPVDICVIDLGLPDKDGLELLTGLRNNGYLKPILILTARDDWETKVDALDYGADDYLTKPFIFEELHARINALIRRSSGLASSIIQAPPLALDIAAHKLEINNAPVSLTAYEYRLLEYLMRNAGEIVSKRALLDYMYPDESDIRDNNVIEVLLNRLRQKLKKSGVKNAIETRRGLGYCFILPCKDFRH